MEMKIIENKLVLWINNENERGIGIINLDTGEWLRKLECPDPLWDSSLSGKIRREINIRKIWKMQNMEDAIFNQFYLIGFHLPYDLYIYDFASFIEEEAELE
jgi:hypothetical protein